MSRLRIDPLLVQPEGRLSYGIYMAATNITNSVVKTTYNGNDSTTDIAEDNTGGGQEEDTTGFYMFISKESEVYDASVIAAYSGITEQIQVVGYKAMNRVPTYVMALDECEVIEDDTTGESSGITTPANYGIEGLPDSGMSITVSNNGTTATTININISTAITANQEWEGELSFPCNIILSEGSDMGDNAVMWYNRRDKCQRIDFKFVWKVDGGSASSSYVLNLTNDSAGINAGSDGHVLTGATKPTCSAHLYFGLEEKTRADGVVFSYSTPQAAAATGVSVSADGVLSLANNFDFLGTTLEITFIATYQGMTFSKIMSITKSFPGADGTGATTRWITTNRDEIKYNPNTNILDPSAITATIMMQVNDNEPTTDTETTLWWDWDKDSLLSHTGKTGTVITTATGHTYLSIGLKNTQGNYYEMETIPVLTDGLNGASGQTGAQGRTGPAIIGPTEWTGADYGRRWHSGTEVCAGDPVSGLPEDLLYIDLIIRVESGQTKYYFCNTSYTEGHADTWSSVSQYWTQSDAEYNFIATKLLLAQNAYIDFLTGNEIYLKYSSGGTDHISGGLAGGTGITIWSGGDQPENAKFSVDYQGNLHAESGVFSGYLQMPYVPLSALTCDHVEHSSYYTYYLDARAYIIASSGMYENTTIVFPTPTSALNGFVYYFLIIGARQGTQTSSERKSCTMKVSGDAQSFVDYVYDPYENRTFSQVEVYGGKYQFVCAEVGGGYNWIMTEATGGANLIATNYTSSQSPYRCFRPVYGYNESSYGRPQVKNIITVSTMPQNGDSNSMYVMTQS